MATVIVDQRARDTYAQKQAGAVTSERQKNYARRMWLNTEVTGSRILRIPYAPQNIQYSGFGMKWSEVERDGVRKNILVPTGVNLKKVSFDVELLSVGHNLTWDSFLKQCEGFTLTGKRMKIRYGSIFEGSYWRLTGFSFESTRRHPKTNGIMEATVHFEFTESHDARPPTGPVAGGIKDSLTPGTAAGRPPAPSKKTPPKKTAAKPSTPSKGTSASFPAQTGSKGNPVPAAPRVTPVRTHVVKKGEHLSGIAIKYYRDAGMWRKIAAFNKIKNPQNVLVGHVLRLP